MNDDFPESLWPLKEKKSVQNIMRFIPGVSRLKPARSQQISNSSNAELVIALLVELELGQLAERGGRDLHSQPEADDRARYEERRQHVSKFGLCSTCFVA